MTSAVELAIDGSGRLVLPKAIREEAGIEPGVPLPGATIRLVCGTVPGTGWNAIEVIVP
jgi:DNA-binding transcriptional regulator/RsmH inhibitor MraZ